MGNPSIHLARLNPLVMEGGARKALSHTASRRSQGVQPKWIQETKVLQNRANKLLHVNVSLLGLA